MYYILQGGGQGRAGHPCSTLHSRSPCRLVVRSGPPAVPTVHCGTLQYNLHSILLSSYVVGVYSILLCSTVLGHYSTVLVHYSTVLGHYSTVLGHYSTVLGHYTTVFRLYSTVQYNTVQFSTAQCNTVLYCNSTAIHRVPAGWDSFVTESTEY